MLLCVHKTRRDHVTSFPNEAEIMDASRVQPIKLARVRKKYFIEYFSLNYAI